MAAELVTEKLRWLTCQGMSRAAEMLSRLLRQQVKIEVAGNSLFAADLVAEQEGHLGVYMPISGELRGGLLLALPEESAGWMSRQLLGMSGCDLLSEPASSTLKEVGNIIASAFLASIDSQLGVRALPEPPQLKIALAREWLEACLQIDSEACFMLRTDLLSSDDMVRGAIYLLATKASLDLLRSRIATLPFSEKSC